MSFSISKRHRSKIGSHLDTVEDIYSLNKHTLGPGDLAEKEWLDADLVAPKTPGLGVQPRLDILGTPLMSFN